MNWTADRRLPRRRVSLSRQRRCFERDAELHQTQSAWFITAMNRPSPVSFRAVLVAALALFVVAGCHPKKPPRTPPPMNQPASAQSVESLRESYRSYYPNSQIGPVIAVRNENRLAAVDGIPPGTVPEGKRVSFVDTNQRVLTTGRIIRLLPEYNRVHVLWDPPPTGGRAPRVGDIMLSI